MKTMSLLEAVTQKVVLLDGAMGTMLIEKGLKPGQVPETWNLEHQESVCAVHKEYVEAGATAILTNTFGASLVKLQESGLSDRCAEINTAGADIARRACRPDTFVIGDIGPAGKILEPFGDLKEKDLKRSFEEQIASLAEAGVDAILFETQMDLREVIVGVQSAKQLTRLPVIASFSFDKKKRGFFTLMGDTVEQAIAGVLEAGADIAGTNCSLDSHDMKDLVSEISRVTKTSIYAKANAGAAQLVNGETVYSQTVEDFMESMPHFLEHNARMIGGCCGTTPAHIAALNKLLNSCE